jgi:hypothetical protein
VFCWRSPKTFSDLDWVWMEEAVFSDFLDGILLSDLISYSDNEHGS